MATTGDNEGTTQRKTRAPYIQRACIECKRRKQRCSGHDPCKNCQSRFVRCNYGNGDSLQNQPVDAGDLRAVTSQVQSLNDLVKSMQTEIQSLKEFTGIEKTASEGGSHWGKHDTFGDRLSKKRRLQPPTTLPVSPPRGHDPPYQGLTSAEYSIKLTSLKLAQLQNPSGTRSPNLDACYDREGARDRDKEEGNEAQASRRYEQARLEQVSVQVFTEISHPRARELVILYSEAVGSLHPVVNIPTVLDCVDCLYARLNEARKTNKTPIGRYDVIVIRLILAIALLSEQNQSSALIASCYEGVGEELNSILSSEMVSLRGVILLLLGAIYHLFCNRIRMAWRLCGTSASLAMELGLHHPETLQKAFPDELERSKALRVIWSIFVLDHGWSAALGLPRNMDDTALDNTQLVPDDCPYLRSMASYCAISTKIVRVTSKILVNSHAYEDEQFQFLNFQIDRWQESVLDGFAISPLTEHGITNDAFDSVSTLLYLRANQLRILLLRPLFFTDSVVKPDQSKISSSLQIAIRTISVIYHLNSTTDIYRKQHPFFSHFLISAISLILLVITYRGNLEDSAQAACMPASNDVCQPLKQALGLISEYSGISNNYTKLYRRLLSIVGLLSHLEILSLDADSGDSHEQYNLSMQNTNHTPAPVHLPEPVELDQFLHITPPLTSIGTTSQQQDSIPDLFPFYQGDHQQMDSFMSGSVWNELDKLLTSRLNSVEPP